MIAVKMQSRVSSWSPQALIIREKGRPLHNIIISIVTNRVISTLLYVR